MGRLLNGVLRIVMMALLSFATIIDAEVTLDGTLRAAGPLAGPNFQIPAEVGRQEGGNLFHSFGEFSIANQESATFTGPNSVDNVIGRVTGGEASQIDGLISNQIPDADLYLINPAGIMFGPNAELDVQGSFHTSTADFLRLGDQGRFDASQPENTVLTAAPPEAFGFVGDSPAALFIDGSQLTVPEDETLSIVGGGIDIDNQATITAPSGRINLASVGDEGEVIPTQDDLEVSAPTGDITVANLSVLDASGEGGGDAFIRAGQLILDESARFPESGINGETLGAASGGVVDIEAEYFQLLNGSLISSNTRSTGRGGDIHIKVTGDLEIKGVDRDGFGGIIAASTLGETEDAGNAGTLKIEARRLVIADGGLISSTSFGGGNGNLVEINLTGEAILSGKDSNDNPSVILSQAQGAGDAGSIIVNAGKLNVEDGALMSTNTFLSGKGGDIEVNVAGAINILGTGSGIFSETSEIASGNAGSIQLEAQELFIKESPGILTNTLGVGNAGDINIGVTGQISLSGENGGGLIGIGSTSQGSGNSGAITISVGQLRLREGAQISTTSFGPGDGNDIRIEEADHIDIAGVTPGNELFSSGIFTETQGSGRGGDLTIVRTKKLEIRDGGEISARSIPPPGTNEADNTVLGDAGSISIYVEDDLRMENGLIGTSTEGADGGEISINLSGMLLLNESEITTSVEDDIGSGGNITIKRPELLVLGSSNIIANAVKGNGGNINIAANQLIKDPVSEIRAESDLGIDGNVNLDAPDVNIIGSLSELPAKFSDATQFMSKPCAQRSGADVIQFIYRNYDVLPESPYGLQVLRPSHVSTRGVKDIPKLEWINDYVSDENERSLFDC